VSAPHSAVARLRGAGGWADLTNEAQSGAAVAWFCSAPDRTPVAAGGLLEAIALAVHLQDVDMMGEPVEESTGEAFRPEDRRPFLERQIGGEHDRAALVTLREHLEQERHPPPNQVPQTESQPIHQTQHLSGTALMSFETDS
jgi:hypothetical protein